MSLPKISVNISLITGGNASIVLNSLRSIEYPSNLFEIIIIEGNLLAKQRNKGVEKSKGDIIYLLDDDSQAQPKSFKILAKEFLNKNTAAIGGPSLTPKNGSYINQLLGYVLQTYFGSFRMRYKWSKQKKSNNASDYHFIAASLAFRKKSAVEIGGFDEKFYPSEETDLVRRIKDKGYLIKYNKKLCVYQNHNRKNSYLLAKRFYNYGQGRMKQLKKNLKIEDYFLLAPVIFGFYLVGLLFFHSGWYFLPLYMYILLGFATAIKASIKYRKVSLLFTMPLIFPIIHLSYATGMIAELLFRPRGEEKNKKLKIIHLKTFKQEKF